MNAERLYTVAKTVRDELTSLKIVDGLTQLAASLEAAINGPNETTQRAVETAYNALVEKLRTAPTNGLSPGMRSVMADLQINASTPAVAVVGYGLINTLTQALEEGYTSVKSLDRLRQIAKDAKALSSAIDGLVNSFTSLGVEDEELEPGKAIVGMTIPRAAIDEKLSDLQRELRFFGGLVKDLTECLEREHGDPKIHSIYSSDLGIDFFTTLQVAAQFATIISMLKAVLDKLGEHRKLKEKAKELGLENEVVDSIERKARASVEEQIEEIEAEIFQNCKLDDQGRVNELKASMKIKLRHLGDKLERGFSFEARTGALPVGAPEDVQSQFENIQAFTTVRFSRLDGPGILQLTEGEKIDEEDEELPAPTRRAKKKKTKTSE